MGKYVRELVARKRALGARYLDTLFPEQRAYVCDESKLLAALCSRRAGKSHANALRLKRAAERCPGETSVYIALTKNHARRIVGRALVDLSRRFEWGVTLKEVDGNLTAFFPNGSRAWLAGAQHRIDFEKFRGDKYSEIQVDEAQLYPFLGEVIDDVLEPAVGDLDGSIVASGTPSPIPTGYFHAVTTGEDCDAEGHAIPKWPTHRWTLAENTFFRSGGGEAYREALRIRRGWPVDHPTLLREYFGQWVRDEQAIVYPYDPNKNKFIDATVGGPTWRKVLSVDLGASESERSTAFTLLAFKQSDPNIYVLKSWKRAGLTPSAVAVQIETVRREHQPGSIVIDAGGLGGGYVKEFNERFGQYAKPAEKVNKLAYVEMLRGDLELGTLKIDPLHNRDLLDEMAVLQWNEERDGFDDRFEDHLCDSLLYGFRECRTHYKPEYEGPKPGTPEFINDESARHKRELEKQILKRQRERARKERLVFR